jgi:ribosomal protein S18 acetylase RimI-like enzyme
MTHFALYGILQTSRLNGHDTSHPARWKTCAFLGPHGGPLLRFRRAKVAPGKRSGRPESETARGFDRTKPMEFGSNDQLLEPKAGEPKYPGTVREGSFAMVDRASRATGWLWLDPERKDYCAYYFPLGPKDVQLFDFYVLPKFRGRAIHWLLTSHILHMLAVEGGARAFADIGEWNQATASFVLNDSVSPSGFG